MQFVGQPAQVTAKAVRQHAKAITTARQAQPMRKRFAISVILHTIESGSSKPTTMNLHASWETCHGSSPTAGTGDDPQLVDYNDMWYVK
jgi:hypothetical protein